MKYEIITLQDEQVDIVTSDAGQFWAAPDKSTNI